MGIDQVLVFCIILVIGLFFFVTMTDYMIPVYLKLEFDSICRDYVLLIEAQNGLDENQKNALKQELTDMDISISSITCSSPGTIKKGDWIVFSVEGEFSRSMIKTLFSREEETYAFRFKQNVVSSKVTN